jgi:hypothetical protein
VAVGAYGISATGDQAGSNTQKSGSISFNTIRDVPSWDAIMSHDCDGLRVIGNDIRNVRNGIDIGHALATNVVKNLTITDNYIEATTTDTWGGSGAVHAGIYVLGFDTTYRVQNVVIEGNTVSGFYNLTDATVSGNAGHIVVGYTDRAKVANNLIVGGASTPSAAAGIFAPFNHSALSITGNTITGTYAAGGVRVATSTITGLTIADNTVNQGTASDPMVYITGSTVTGATIRGNGGTGTVPLTVGTTTITYAQRNGGATSVADGGTISHGLATTPTSVRVATTTSGELASVTAVAASTFTVAIKTHAGAAGTTAVVYWEAEI